MNVRPRKPNLITRCRILVKIVSVILMVGLFGGMVAYSYVETKLGKITRPDEKIDEAELSCVDSILPRICLFNPLQAKGFSV